MEDQQVLWSLDLTQQYADIQGDNSVVLAGITDTTTCYITQFDGNETKFLEYDTPLEEQSLPVQSVKSTQASPLTW